MSRPILIPSEQLEPVLARVIGEAWSEIDTGSRTPERFHDLLLTLARVADAAGATHASIAINNHLGQTERRYPGVWERVTSRNV